MRQQIVLGVSIGTLITSPFMVWAQTPQEWRVLSVLVSGNDMCQRRTDVGKGTIKVSGGVMSFFQDNYGGAGKQALRWQITLSADGSVDGTGIGYLYTTGKAFEEGKHGPHVTVPPGAGPRVVHFVGYGGACRKRYEPVQ